MDTITQPPRGVSGNLEKSKANELNIGRSIMVSIPPCHGGDPGSIPGDREPPYGVNGLSNW